MQSANKKFSSPWKKKTSSRKIICSCRGQW